MADGRLPRAAGVFGVFAGLPASAGAAEASHGAAHPLPGLEWCVPFGLLLLTIAVYAVGLVVRVVRPAPRMATISGPGPSRTAGAPAAPRATPHH